MPSLPSYGTGPRAIIPLCDFIRYGDGLLVTVLKFKPLIDLVPVLNKIILIMFYWSLFSYSSNLFID